MMDTGSTEEIAIATACVMVGIGNYDKRKMREGELKIILGEMRWPIISC